LPISAKKWRFSRNQYYDQFFQYFQRKYTKNHNTGPWSPCYRYNCRNVTFAGSIFCALGIGLSGFATSIYVLFLTFGLLTGIGVGLSTTPGANPKTSSFATATTVVNIRLCLFSKPLIMFPHSSLTVVIH
jgi:hypothetical protein